MQAKGLFTASLQQSIAMSCFAFSMLNSLTTVFPLRLFFYASEDPCCSPLVPLRSILHSQNFSRTFTPAVYSRRVFSCILWFLHLFTHPSMLFAFILFCNSMTLSHIQSVIDYNPWSLFWRSKALRWWDKLIAGNLILSVSSRRLVG